MHWARALIQHIIKPFIVIGAKNNTHTTLRKQNSELLFFENITPGVLVPDVPIKIELEIAEGKSNLVQFMPNYLSN